ncbi:MAG: hypothetical protein WAK03_09600, partial [Methylocystis sp.]
MCDQHQALCHAIQSKLARSRAHGILSRSASHALAEESLGARQSPRGESEPPELTLGPFGIAVRLNWLVSKKR